MRLSISNVLDRLLPERWRKTPVLAPKERHILWKQVAPGDPGLRAITDMLGEIVQSNVNAAMDINKTKEVQLLGLQAAGVARGILFAMEDEWQAAREELSRELTAEKK